MLLGRRAENSQIRITWKIAPTYIEVAKSNRAPKFGRFRAKAEIIKSFASPAPIPTNRSRTAQRAEAEITAIDFTGIKGRVARVR